MIQSYSVSVPCKGYIKKYFQKLYGTTIPLNHSSDFGITVLTMMSSTPLIRVNKRILNLSTQYNDCQLQFQLPIDFFYRIENKLTEQQAFAINRYLENVFQADLFQMVNVGAFFGVERRNSIERFANKFDIVLEEDISSEALIKQEYRSRKSGTAKNIFLASLSSPFSTKLTA